MNRQCSGLCFVGVGELKCADGSLARRILAILAVLVSSTASRAEIISHIGPNDGALVGVVEAAGSGIFLDDLSFGLAAFEIELDGNTLLRSIRFDAAMSILPQGSSNRLDFSGLSPAIARWKFDDFVGEFLPDKILGLPSQPDNWTGFVEHSPSLILPNTTPSGNYGNSGAIAESFFRYEYDNLDSMTVVETPPEAGRYIYGLAGTNDREVFGSMGVGLLGNGGDIIQWYNNKNMDPTLVSELASPNTRMAVSATFVTAVPEPASLVLLGVCGVSFALLRRERKTS